MADQVGTVLVHRLQGQISPARAVVEVLEERVGVDGADVRINAKKGKPFQVQGMTDFATLGAARDFLTTTLPAMVGTNVNVLIATVNHGNYLVFDADGSEPRFVGQPFGAISGSGLAACWVVEVVWQLVDVNG